MEIFVNRYKKLNQFLKTREYFNKTQLYIFFTNISLAYIRKTHWYTLNQDAHITVKSINKD